jgi:hypothetical protein
MNAKRIFHLAVAGGLAVVLASCGSDDAEIQAYAKQAKMPENQKVAFTACASDLRRNKPRFPAKDGQILMKSVPMEVCACQSRTIVNIFKSDQYKNHATFAEYMAKEQKKRQPRFSKKVLQDGVNPKDATPRLEKSLAACVDGYKSANKDNEEALAVFELVPTPPPEKDKKAEKKSS